MYLKISACIYGSRFIRNNCVCDVSILYEICLVQCSIILDLADTGDSDKSDLKFKQESRILKDVLVRYTIVHPIGWTMYRVTCLRCWTNLRMHLMNYFSQF